MFKTHRTFTLETGVKSNSIAVFNQGKAIIVLYHKTPVAIIAGSTLVLNNGGWDTVSTRAVMNRVLELVTDSGTPEAFDLRIRLVRKRGKTFLEQAGLIRGEYKNNMRIKLGRTASEIRGET